MHFLYKKYKIRKDWSLLYFVIRTNRSLPKFGKFREIEAPRADYVCLDFKTEIYFWLLFGSYHIIFGAAVLVKRTDCEGWMT